MPMADERITGTVTKITGGQSTVDAGDVGVFTCDLRGRLFRRERIRLAVGDEVELVRTGDGSDAVPGPDGQPRGVIDAVRPRRSSLRRARDFKRDQVVVANVDRIWIVVAAFDPPYKRQFIDRLVVGIERDSLAPGLVVNKVDLADAEYLDLVREDAGIYGRLGYETRLVSASSGAGLDELRAALRGRISAFVGPSGAGKSTLLNALCPGLGLRTAEVSAVDGRGRHTTTSAELVRLPGGGFVVDTPGVRGFGLWDLEPGEVLSGFRDVADVATACKYANCGHRAEKGCSVLAALEAGELDEERYESFLKLRDEVDAEAATRQSGRRR
jgi:ribosome biogenesis GTPase